MSIAENNKDNLNIMEFGASGDGISDDTSAIQEAINTATECQKSDLEQPFRLKSDSDRLK